MKLTKSLLTILSCCAGVQAFTAHSNNNKAFHRTATSTSTTSLHAALLEGRKMVGALKPVNNFILVKTLGIQEKTDEGILLAGSSKVVKTRGTVISVGPGKTHPETGYRLGIPLEEGDGVLYGKYDGTEIDLDGEAHMLIRDDDVMVTYSGDKLELDTVSVIRDWVLVHVDTKDQETAGGLLLAAATSEQNRPSTGTVVKVGEGAVNGEGELMPMTVSIGDRVKFRDYAGNEVEIEGEDYSVVRLADVLAKY